MTYKHVSSLVLKKQWCSPGETVVKHPPVNAGDTGDVSRIPGWGGSPGGGNGSPLQCSCLENPMDGGAWWATVPGVVHAHKEKNTNTHLSYGTCRSDYRSIFLAPFGAVIPQNWLCLLTLTPSHPFFSRPPSNLAVSYRSMTENNRCNKNDNVH